jgi:hypothetical protein
MKPGSLSAFLVLAWLNVVFGTIFIIIILIIMIDLGDGSLNAYLIFVGVPAAIALLLSALIIGVGRGSAIARNLYTAVAALLIAFILLGFFTTRVAPLEIAIGTLQMVLMTASIIFAFQPALSNWLASGTAAAKR